MGILAGFVLAAIGTALLVSGKGLVRNSLGLALLVTGPLLSIESALSFKIPVTLRPSAQFASMFRLGRASGESRYISPRDDLF